MTSEEKIGLAVMQIAAQQINKTATFVRSRIEIPNLVKLNASELAISGPRHPEPMWHQIVRNIKSHHGLYGNFIDRGWLEHVSRVGYKITPSGEAHLKAQGLL
jgi:hypothetical protein